MDSETNRAHLRGAKGKVGIEGRSYWRHVIWSANKRCGKAGVMVQYPGQPKVPKFHILFAI